MILGGLVTAPIAGKFVSVLPRSVLGVAVGLLVLPLAGCQADARDRQYAGAELRADEAAHDRGRITSGAKP